jgi:predicted GH43/DUF377 family glycosyl hydrolase
MHFLYYAGMAADRQTEQIGLACSRDGIHFERDGSGLIIPIDPATPWKSLRTCNPTVIRERSSWTMFYQGVGRNASGDIEHVIARAVSTDGRSWSCEPAPLITFDAVRSAIKEWESAAGGGVIEPSVIARDGRYEMVFVGYQGTYATGTWLCHADSADGIAWKIASRPLCAPSDFAGLRVHYPQLMEDSRLWFTVIGQASRAAAICGAQLDGQGRLANIRQHLPARDRLRADTRQVLPVASSRLNQWANRLVHGGRNYWGYAHSHLLPAGGGERLYYHSYHRNAGGQMWMDIGSCAWDGRGGGHAVGLSPASDADAWDAFFVADPFVVSDH